MKRSKKKWRPALAAIAAALVLVLGLPITAHAQRVTDNISVYVGYTGGPYALKATYSWRELDDLYGGALPTVQEIYSYYGVARTAIVSARGFYLTDLLEHAGIDMNSVYSMAFYTDDKANGAFTSFTKTELIDKPRYYYPNIAVDPETEEMYARDGGDMESGAVRVEPMMALEDNWEWDAISENFTAMNASSRFHLLFGQAYPSEHRSGQSAKYVNAVYVTFSGVPSFGTESNLEAKVGTDYRVTADITAADDALEQYMRDHLVWTSSDPDIIDVDSTGKLTIKKEGTVQITVSFGDMSDTVTVSTGDGAPGGDGSGASAGAKADSGLKVDSEEIKEIIPEETDSSIFMLTDDMMNREDFAEWVNSMLNQEQTAEEESGSLMNWRQEQMADDSEQLVLTEEEVRAPALLVGASAAGLLVIGVIHGLAAYRFRRKHTAKDVVGFICLKGELLWDRMLHRQP